MGNGGGNSSLIAVATPHLSVCVRGDCSELFAARDIEMEQGRVLHCK